MSEKLDMTNVNLLNAVRNTMSVDYRDRVPQATKDNIDAISKTLTDPYNPMARNELVPALVNLIVSQSISTEAFRNPLRILNSNAMPYGNGEQEVYVNFAQGYAHDANISIEDATAIYDSYIMALYHKINFNNDYPVTIYYEDLRGAFLDSYGLKNLISAKVESVVSACNWDEFTTAKELIASAKRAGQIYPVHVDAVTDQASANALAKQIQSYIDKIQFPNPLYNFAGATSAAKEDTILLFVDPDTKAAMNVDSYASAYNLDRMIPKAQQVLIDNFNDAEGIVAVLVDKRFFKIREQYRLMVQDNVNRGLRWNSTYTVKEMFSYSLFYPIIVFTTENVLVSSINATDVGLVKAGTDVDFGGSFSVTSTGVADKAINVKVEGNSSNDTFVIPGTTILRIAKDEKNLKAKANKTTSVRVVITSRYDSTKTATIYFTTD
nr:MAG TPA: Head protein [Caudoviricetes sp.]